MSDFLKKHHNDHPSGPTEGGKAEEIVKVAKELINLAEKIFKEVQKIDDKQHKAEAAFTKNTIDLLRQMYPDKNALICHAPPHANPNFSGVIASDHYELPLPGDGLINFHQTQGYDWWIFDSGDFTRNVDAGFINWCFAGNFTRGFLNTENKVQFEPIAPRSTPPPPVSTIVETTPNPVRTHPDGVYFVNCRRGNEISSGLAYYKDMNGQGGSGPNDYVDVVHGSFTTWERTGSAKYKNGTTFHWNIYGNAQELPDYARVGVCDNGYNTYNVYKDKQRVIYTIDGWQCTTIYWCF